MGHGAWQYCVGFAGEAGEAGEAWEAKLNACLHFSPCLPQPRNSKTYAVLWGMGHEFFSPSPSPNRRQIQPPNRESPLAGRLTIAVFLFRQNPATDSIGYG